MNFSIALFVASLLVGAAPFQDDTPAAVQASAPSTQPRIAARGGGETLTYAEIDELIVWRHSLGGCLPGFQFQPQVSNCHLAHAQLGC